MSRETIITTARYLRAQELEYDRMTNEWIEKSSKMATQIDATRKELDRLLGLEGPDVPARKRGS